MTYPPENGVEDVRQLRDVEQDDDDADDDVENGHGRHQVHGDVRQAFQAAQGDGQEQDDENRACQVRRHAVVGVHDAGNGVGLDQVGAHHLDAHEDRDDDAQPGHLQAVADVVHGAGEQIAFLVAAAVQLGQDDFAIFQGFAEEGGNPHPEDGAHAAGDDGRGDADDVAAAHVAGQGDHHGLKGGNGAVALVDLAGLEGVDQGRFHDELKVTDLYEPVRDGVEDTQRQKDEDQPPSPQPGVDEGKQLFQGV